MDWCPCPSGKHDWKPIPLWRGRYTCSKCQALGYRVGALFPWKPDQDVITPYICRKCGGPRTTYNQLVCPSCKEGKVSRWNVILLPSVSSRSLDSART